MQSQNASVEIRTPSEEEKRPIRPTRTERAQIALGGVDGRQRLERDLHDGVQNELVAPIVKLGLAEHDPPPLLADFGLREALRAQAVRVGIRMRLVRAAPRSTEQAEAVYYSCSEAIQNAAKHTGRAADRIEGFGGSFGVASQRGLGTVLTISLPWPAEPDGRR